MKRILICLLAMVLLAACGAEPVPTPPPEIPTTLMVYMIGSDLESRSGAATRDLQEMVESGVDTQTNRVLVCAGGTEFWHNEDAVVQKRTVLSLTEAGFEAVAELEAASMGQPESLTEFLKYAYENYPSQRYALVLWDHGNGPLMGYGKDTLYDGDALLLQEMAEALEASPFAENKLSWIGFDACLMSSLELACTLDDYAHYLVASQEIEPAFGWNYSFLSRLSRADVPGLLTSLTEEYLATCQSYYEERGYEDRDTTLCCMDLSRAGAVEQAVDALFSVAKEDLEQQYNLLTVRRVQTRALGRASTGSEYDLIDLGDLAAQLQTVYPEAAQALQREVDTMVVSNATNAQGLCGVSLYYPFFNKYHYEAGWAETYNALEVLPAYRSYLEKYREVWLQNDMVDQLAQSLQPREESAGVYVLPLTKDQQAHFAQARYRILRRETDDLYNCLFTSSDVTNMDGVLVANFDGKVIYVRDSYCDEMIPVVEEHDRVGDISRYSVYVGLSNDLPTGNVPEGQERVFKTHRYHLALDGDEVHISALLPHNETVDPAAMTGGKLEDADMGQWSEVLFWQQYHRYLTRDEKGAILPFDQWYTNSAFTGYEFYLVDGMEFVYEPLAGGEYYLLLEITDTHGSRYCSELLPITVEDTPRPVYEKPVTRVQWQSGEKVPVKEEGGVALYLTTAESWSGREYTLELVNQNDFPVQLRAYDLIFNGNILSDDYFGGVEVEPGATAQLNYSKGLGLAGGSGELDELRSVQFDVQVRSMATGEALIRLQTVEVTLSPETAIAPGETSVERCAAAWPFLGARAERQQLLRTEALDITLLGCGAAREGGDCYAVLRVENFTDEPQFVAFPGITLGDVYVPVGGAVNEIPADTVCFFELELTAYQLQSFGTTQIGAISLPVELVSGYELMAGDTQLIRCPVELAEKAPVTTPLRESQRVIFEENGVRVAIEPVEAREGNRSWRATVYNGSDRDISVSAVDLVVDGEVMSNEYHSFSFYRLKADAGQYSVGELNYYGTSVPAEQLGEIRFRIQLRDMAAEEVLYTGETVVTVKLN